jgi:YidC/Oxa1 family membrane protein insertase
VLALGVFQALLNSIGWVLAKIYDLVGSYGLSILILTILIKIVLLPLGIKQIKSMQSMQVIQPKIKELQKKYKGNKQKAQEETMKLYKEAGVNPLGGCLPLLLQFPILISMYAVIRAPLLQPVTTGNKVTAYAIHNDHLPVDSQLFKNVVLHQNLSFLGVNLQCSASQSGTDALLGGTDRNPVKADLPILQSDGKTPLPFAATTGDGTLPCGSKSTDKIPYFALLLFMVATTFYQQRQMQKASPPGASSGQQQAILKIMPLMFGIFGFTFPAGLTLYWTVSNLWQIGQQYALLKAGHIGPDALERRIADQRTKNAKTPPKTGFMAKMQERAAQAQAQKKPGTSAGRKPASGSAAKGPQPKGRRPNTGGSSKAGGSPRTGGNPKSGGNPKTGGNPKPGRRPNTDPRKRGGGSGGEGDGEAGA